MTDELSKILCAWCSAPWSTKNIKIWDVDGRDQCESGRFESPTYSITIKCHSCGKEMYRKEGVNSSYGEGDSL